MRQRVAAVLLVVACALAGMGLGYGDRAGSQVAAGPDDGLIRCDLVLGGSALEDGAADGSAPEDSSVSGDDPAGDEPPLLMTREPSGLLKGYVLTPAAFLMAKRDCTGAVPDDVLWQSFQGPQQLDGVQFTGSELAKLHVYDGDPLGRRTWRVSTEVPGVRFGEVEMDIRFGTAVRPAGSAARTDGSLELTATVLRYSPEAVGLVPYGGVGVSVQHRCGTGDWTELSRTETDRARGSFTVVVPPDLCADLRLRAVPDDSDDTWGRPVELIG